MALSGNKLLALLEDSDVPVKKTNTTASLKARNLARASGGYENDVAPVYTATTKKKKKDEEEDVGPIDLFQKGALDDGITVGTISKAILGTAGDVGVGAVKGASKLVGGVADAASMGIAGIADAIGKDDYANRLRHSKSSADIIDEKLSGVDSFLDKYSVLGKTGDALAEGLGQVGAIILTGGAAASMGLSATAATTGLMGISSLGSGMSEAYAGGATDEEAATYGLVKGVVDAGSELIFGGLGKTVKALGISKGLSSLDDVFAQKLSSKIANQTAKNLVQFGVKATAEGVEEILAGLGTAVGKKLTYMSEQDLKSLVKDENLLEQFVVGAVTSGITQSGIVPGMKSGSVIEANKTGRDFISGMSANEQKVVDKVVQDRIAEAEKNSKITNKEKNVIYDKALSDMERGYISTDTIEEVLGGNSYTNWKNTVDSEEAIKKELDTLNNIKKSDLTGAQEDRLNELKGKLEDIKKNSKRNDLKNQLGSEVMTMVKGDRLIESYNERSRRGQAFKADLSQYDAKQQATIKKAMESGILNNTNRTHEFVDLVAKISADTGMTFDFTNNQRLKDSGFAVEGKTVNGYKTKDGVTVNIESAKALNSVVGHEITHVLEGTEFYSALQDAVKNYAIHKEGLKKFNARLKATEQMYKGIGDPDMELTADLVGDYLFTDADFINRLSTEHRNVFEKLYDNIKYLCRLATAGSKEARELEQVKKKFEDAYRAVKNPTTAKTTVKSDTKATAEQTAVDESESEAEVERVNEAYGTVESILEMNRINNTLANAIIGNKDVAEAFRDITGVELTGTTEQKRQLIRDTVKKWQEMQAENEAIAMEAGEQWYRDTDYRSIVISKMSPKGTTTGNAMEILRRPELRREWEALTGKTLPKNYKSALKMVQQTKRNPAKLAESAKYSITEAQNEKGLNNAEEVSYSLSHNTEYMDKAIAANDSSMTVDKGIMEEAKIVREKIAARMNEIKDKGLVGLPEDVEGNTYFANSSYDGSEENTTICPRSLASEAFVDAVSEYLGRPLSVEEQIYISQDLQGRTMTPECLYCYVATDRKAYRAFLGEWVKQRDAVLKKLKANPDADVSRNGKMYEDFRNGRKDTNQMYNRFKMWVNAYKNGTPMIDASHLANINKLMGDINSEFGAELKPQIVDAMKYAQSASWAKKRVNYVAYNGHILKWKQSRIDKLNSHYGLRMYSFSDFHPAFVLENMQMITDASVRGLKMLGYTKDTDFVEIFAPTGMNINVSTFGFESGGQVFENNITGANWDTAKDLRSKYPNVGVTFVATNDTLVEWALSQDWIDVVIPYHLVRTGAEVAKALNYTNYTGESSDTKTADWKKGDAKYIAPTEHNNDKATYLSALERNHLKPRFERFIDNPNYMKLVNECRQSSSESKPVQPVFGEDAAMKALAKLETTGYYQPIGGSVDRMYEIAAEVAENMTQQIAPTMSLSNTNEQFAPIGSYNIYGSDVALVKDDIGPVKRPEQSVVNQNDVNSSVDSGEQTTAEESTKPTRKQLHQTIVDNIRKTFAAKGFDFDKVLKNAKNLSTLATVDNTPQRVMEKALGYKEGQTLADLTVNKAAQNESEGIKWLNQQVKTIKEISKQYGIKPGSKQSAAAQMYAEGFYVAENNDIVKYGDAELAKDFPNVKVQQNIKMLANDPRIRRIYDETLSAINESRTRNAYPEIPRLDNYFLHFRAMEDTFSKLGLPFNPNDIRAKDLPTDLNGVTADLKPGQPYFASANHRRGKRTSFDLLGGLERYLNSAKNQIYHIDDIQTLRALRNHIAETYGQAVGLENLDTLTNEEAQERIEQIYGSHLSTFAKFLNEEANVLAGKTALIDRGLEGIIGRRGMTFMNTLNGQVGSNMVGFNISSSLTNFLPVAQTLAKTNKFDFTKAFTQTVANKLSGGKLDNFAKESPVVIRRKGVDSFYRTPWQKTGDLGYVFMSAVDDISTEIIARTKYNELTRKGMDQQKAHFETDKWVSRLMGDRSIGQQPQLYNSKMLGLVTKFQLEVRNQLDSQFYDTFKEADVSTEHIQNGVLRNATKAAKITSTLLQLAAVQHLYGTAFEKIAGYNPAFDIVEVLMTAFGYDDEEDSEDTTVDNLTQALLVLAEDLPYTSILLDGGRVPMSSAIPDFASVLRGEDEYGNEIGFTKALTDEVKEIAPYYLMPGGYGQLKKTMAGLKMYSDEHPIAGSYTDSGNLRFSVGDAPLDKVKAAIFGQYSSENAREYFDKEERTLNPDQTKILAELDVPIEEYWAYRDELNKFNALKDELYEASRADDATSVDVLKNSYIYNVSKEIDDLYKQQKEYANGTSLLKSGKIKEIQKQMEQKIADSKKALSDAYVSGYYAEIGGKRFDYNDSKGKWYEISGNYLKREQKAVNRYDITPEQYWNNTELYSKANEYFDGLYSKDGWEYVAKTVFGGNEFAPYAVELSQIKGEDLDGDGKSDNGTKKAKIFSYIDGLNISEDKKNIIKKMHYSSYDDSNYEIIEYLNSRKDLSYDERVSVLRELGFTVTDDGNISWK